MFCPHCRAEYRPGFSRCSDCDVPLVATLPGAEDQENQGLKIGYTTEDQMDCVVACKKLIAANIPFRVLDEKLQALREVDARFSIGVPAELYDQANELLQEGKLDFNEDEPAMELADSNEAFTSPLRGKNWDPDGWFPEDATEEIWTENKPMHTQMIEACLRENLIHVRTDVSPDGSTRVFVMSEDEVRAREIVREIVEGTPLV